MKKLRTTNGRSVRLAAFIFLAALLFAGTSFLGGTNVEANHPVLVEGNCDSPVPGTTIVTAGTCGDFDGDGRIGVAEDTDGADRIFGTIKAALGPGTGAAAGTGANQNGKIIIVASGRFAEVLFIGQGYDAAFTNQFGGVASPGNVTIEAAPGVNADIDAVLQGDPAGGNNFRQGNWGILINYPAGGGLGGARSIVLRNLQIRNFEWGVLIDGASRVTIDNCRFEGNRVAGVNATNSSRVAITNSQFNGNGFRIGSAVNNTPGPGDGLRVEGTAQARVAFSNFTHNAGNGIANFSTTANAVSVFHVTTFFNSVNTFGPITVGTDPAQ